jgi:hypothetical protein
MYLVYREMVKFALLIGINYVGQSHALNGCINDIDTINSILVNNLGYKSDNIVMLSDDGTAPTAMNIIRELYNLVHRANSDNASEIFIHYSGHGSHIRDRSGDETDGYDEVLVPVDCNKAGCISDDMISGILEKVPLSCKCLMLFDCCHSGTIADLKYVYRDGQQSEVENKNSKIKSNIVMISGCRDSQTSADAWINSDWSGAMTASFSYVMNKHNFDIGFFDLVSEMRDYLKTHGYTQYPVLSTSCLLSSGSKFC